MQHDLACASDVDARPMIGRNAIDDRPTMMSDAQK
jgi:hypothetical protein